jgi:uncharacterized repeat protein (TIGR02543 family)
MAGQGRLNLSSDASAAAVTINTDQPVILAGTITGDVTLTAAGARATAEGTISKIIVAATATGSRIEVAFGSAVTNVTANVTLILATETGATAPATTLVGAGAITEQAVYRVTFDKNTGTTEASPGYMLVNQGETSGTLPTAPTKAGYTFASWNTAANGSGTAFDALTAVTANVTVYAEWTAIPAAVIDIAAIPGVTAPVTGAVPVATITATAQYTGTVAWAPAANPFAGSTVYTATITLTPTAGYTLTGVAANFFTVAGATATNAADSGVVSAVFPATAAANTYTVTFDSQGGSAVSPQDVAYGGLLTKPAAPTRTGYTFGGWYKESSCTNLWNFGSDTVTGTTTLYAKWTVTSGFANTITLSASPQSIPADGVSILTLTAIAKDQFGDNVADGTVVTFTTDLGTISNITTTTNGITTATLTASSTSGVATVTATCNGKSSTPIAVFMNKYTEAEAEHIVTEQTSPGIDTVDNPDIGVSTTKSGAGTPVITIAKYADDPAGAATLTSPSGYYDVHLDSVTEVDSVTVRFCPADEGTIFYYWNGTEWISASDQTYDNGCIVVTITSTTHPNLNDLTGLMFARGGTSSSNIVATCTSGGTISPSGAVAVNGGADQAFTITPDLHYHVADVLVDGVSVGAVPSYTFTNVTASHTIAATFAVDTVTFTIRASAGSNGTISPSGAVAVNGGAGQAFTITPDLQYHVADVLVDGVSVGAVPSYTFTNVTASHTITAAFAGNTYEIAVFAGLHGRVTPGSGPLAYHATQAYAVKPDLGYLIDTLTVDGVVVKEAANKLGYTVTLTDVESNHTIAATFRPVPDMLAPTITLPDFSSMAGVIGWSGGLVQTFTVGTSPFPLTFTLEDNSGSVKWTIKVNGVVIVDPVGTGFITYLVPLSEGRNDVEISASDAAGNYTSQKLVIYLDSMNPVLTIEPILPASVAKPELTITGSVVDAVSGLKSVTINGTDVIQFLDGSFRETLLLTKGANSIVIEAEDRVGHKVSATYTVTYAVAVPPLLAVQTVTLTIGKAEMDVNGMPVALDAAPLIQNGRTLLPLRALIETLGGKVAWNGTTRTATVTLGSRTVAVTIGNPTGIVNGKKVAIDPANTKVVPLITNNRTFLPLRFIAENLGLDLAWDALSRTVSFTYWP